MPDGPKRGTGPNTVIALAVVCAILSVSLVATVAYCSSAIQGRDSTIEANNSHISSLDSQIAGLQEQVVALSSAPAFRPVQFSGSVEIASGTLANGMTYFYVVPNGSWLVIEYVSARVDNLDRTDTLDLQVVTWVNSTRVEHYLGTASPQGRYRIDPYSQPGQFVSKGVCIYAEPGSHVSVECSRDTRLNDAVVAVSFSGYFMDAS